MSYDNEKSRVVVLGPPKSGKTVFLTVLYSIGSKPSANWKIVIRDGGEEILTEHLRRILRGKWPQKTAPGRFEKIGLELVARQKTLRIPYDKRITLEIPDYSGELLTPETTLSPGLIKKMRKQRTDKKQVTTELEQDLLNEIMSANAYVLILDPSLPDIDNSEAEEREKQDRLELEMTHITLITKLATQEMNAKPMLVLLTKADTLQSDIESEKFAKDNYPRFFAQLESDWDASAVKFCSVGVRTSDVGPAVPLNAFGYDGVIRWLLTSL